MSELKTKNKMGAPTKYRKIFLKVIEYLMNEGASKTEVCATIGISYETLMDWMDKDSPRYNNDFSATIKKGELLSQGWWEEYGRKSLENKEFSYVGWYMNMKNRFRKSHEQWADKQSVDLNHSGKIVNVTRKRFDGTKGEEE